MNLKPEMWVMIGLVAIAGGTVAGFTSAAPPATVTAELPDTSNGRRLLVFESSSCGWCIKFRERIEPAYIETVYQQRAPLHYVKAGSRMAKQYRVRSTPTLIFVESDGRELGRLVGYPGGMKLYHFLDKHP